MGTVFRFHSGMVRGTLSSVLESLFPISWLATTMSYCDYLHDPFLFPVNHRKGKSSHDISTRSGNVRTRKLGKSPDLFDGLVEFINEGFRRCRVLSGIPFECDLRFRQRLFVKANRFGRHLPRKDTSPRLCPRNRFRFSRV